jgi:RNA polymerase sigma factor (TIGR02999 family)
MEDQDVSKLLVALTEGDRGALDELFPIVYESLRRVAHRQLMDERPDHTLNTTALVHEAYLKLVKLPRVQWKGRAHFFALAAQAMRNILVDYARLHRAAKRGGGEPRLSLDGVVAMTPARAGDLLALDAALTQLEALNARHARVVECRFFGGMGVKETAAVLGTSPATVKRDWVMARAWLNRALSNGD